MSSEEENEHEVEAGEITQDVRSLPGELPVLPLRNTVLFPTVYTRTPMIATTERAKELIDYAVEHGELLLAVAARDRENPEPGAEDLYDVGSVVRIVKIEDGDDGSKRLWVQGIRRARITSIERSEPFLFGSIEPLEDEIISSVELEALERTVNSQFMQIAAYSPSIPEAVRDLVSTLKEPAVLADVISANLTLQVPEQQELLEQADVRARLQRLSEHLARELEVHRLEEEIRNQVQEDLSRSQREYVLREQARAIRRQLGEYDSPEDQVDDLRERLDACGAPEDVRETAERELQRLAAMPPGAMEGATLRTYLELIVELPWDKETEDVLDVKRAREILEEDHYDLEKVKDRILEFIAVLKLKRDMKGPILCFAGPPGTGKTSLGRSIARAMGREFARIALGGVRDEAEIRGHRRTYVGSLPGRVIQTLRRVETRNPVIMLDEIDKLGTDFRGDPASALLEVLDPEQNSNFSDHYLEVPFDLSKVLFIATANVLDSIPPALRDRMEIIEVPGYTEEDKLEIARRYLVPRQLERHGLKDQNLEIPDDTLKLVISNYTREAGLRNLEREIGKLMRKLAREFVEDGTLAATVEPDRVPELLGPTRFEPEIAGRLQIPGVSVGLAVTQAGGEILFIEASRSPGKGNLKITGSLGDVMRESVQTAVALVRTLAPQLGIDPDLFNQSDLHVHVPAGATPKDGPSAGTAIVTALISLFCNRPVTPDLAMTGEISLRGRVLPVGGVKEKVLAARRAGLTRVLLPAENAKDLADIPESRLRELTVVPIENVSELVRHAFEMEISAS